MKTIIKLVIAALVIHATWRAGTVYLRYYEFKDEVTQIAQFGVNETDNELRDARAGRGEAARHSRRAGRRHRAAPATTHPHRRELHRAGRAPAAIFLSLGAKMHVDVLTLVLQEAK